MKTKNNFIYSILIAGIATTTVFTGCKKGENDPFISLKSRTSRLAGEWKVSEGSGENVNNGTKTTWTQTETSKTTVSGSQSTTDQITAEYTFDKEGTYKSKEVRVSKYTVFGTEYTETVTTDEEGVWNFTGGSGDTKEKSQLALQTTKTTTTQSTTPTSTWSGDGTTTSSSTGSAAIVFDIDQLKSKEMVWKYTGSSTSGSNTSSSTGTWTLTAK
jgi:hypothetical protein